jgi:hypothetical protein
MLGEDVKGRPDLPIITGVAHFPNDYRVADQPEGARIYP